MSKPNKPNPTKLKAAQAKAKATTGVTDKTQTSALTDPVEYKLIPNFPGYRAGSDGSIWSCLKQQGSRWHNDKRWEPIGEWKIRKPCCRKPDNRRMYTLTHKNGKRYSKSGSYFMLLAFVGPRQSGMEACHWDGDCQNDAISNLRWDTRQANAADKQRHGTQTKGEAHHSAKLTVAAVREIRLRATVGEKHRDLAKIYGISKSNISNIICRRRWAHV